MKVNLPEKVKTTIWFMIIIQNNKNTKKLYLTFSEGLTFGNKVEFVKLPLLKLVLECVVNGEAMFGVDEPELVVKSSFEGELPSTEFPLSKFGNIGEPSFPKKLNISYENLLLGKLRRCLEATRRERRQITKKYHAKQIIGSSTKCCVPSIGTITRLHQNLRPPHTDFFSGRYGLIY